MHSICPSVLPSGLQVAPPLLVVVGFEVDVELVGEAVVVDDVVGVDPLQDRQ